MKLHRGGTGTQPGGGGPAHTHRLSAALQIASSMRAKALSVRPPRCPRAQPSIWDAEAIRYPLMNKQTNKQTQTAPRSQDTFTHCIPSPPDNWLGRDSRPHFTNGKLRLRNRNPLWVAFLKICLRNVPRKAPLDWKGADEFCWGPVFILFSGPHSLCKVMCSLQTLLQGAHGLITEENTDPSICNT